jgi:hypothetical protein
LRGASDEVLRECVQRWCGAPPEDLRRRLEAATSAMEDEQLVSQRIGSLPRKLQDLLEAFFADGGAVRSVQALQSEVGGNFRSRFDLEASLAALHREGFVWIVKDKRWTTFESVCWAVPSELVECVLAARRRRQSQLQDVLTLQGFLEARFFRDRPEARSEPRRTNGKAASGSANGAAAKKTAEPDSKSADHARKIYKLYTLESAMTQRLQRLPPAVAGLVDVALQRHGGIAPWDELQRELELPGNLDRALVDKCLTEAMVGTTASLDLARIGVQPAESAVVIFHEVALHAIRRRGEGQAPQVTEELVCGGDFATNVRRFLHELQQSKVLFTSEGELFKASQKRIASLLLPVPGGMLEQEPMLELIYRFCLHRRLIDRRGERSLRPTPAGVEFDRAQLHEQTKMLLSHFVEDRSLPGEPFHQTRMRRVLLRLLRRAEPRRWQDVSILPFLSRNAYLAQIDVTQTEEFFAARFKGGGYTPTETLQQMCWNLLVWIKKRLFPIGIVDVGTNGGRITALRLSALGAELLDADPAGKLGGVRCSVIVQPDFELIVFPGDDVHEVVHLFDRFARRTKSDHVHQFRLERDTIAAGLADGLTGAQIVQELTDRARAPIPQNVLYMLDEWTQRPPA